MIRKKVQLAYITNDSSRKATYKKINKGLKKKMKGQQVLSKFRMILEMEQRKNMVNQESFLSQRTVKVVEQLKKHCKDNQEKEMTLVMFNNICGKWVIHGFNFRDINDLNEKINNIDKRMDAFVMTPLYTQRASSSSSSSMVALPLMTMVMPKAMSRTSDWMMFQFGDNINPNNGH
ncbi:hypothetical protein GOBAR_DD13578 [Gossypium barbadense]|nr:hypothetical protein GOBAR_DD13578 [Gossypium barbadense]